MPSLASKLQTLVKRDPRAATVLAYLARYTKDHRVTRIDLLAASMGMTPRETREVMHKLEEFELGRLILGRHRMHTRFEWSKPLTGIAKLAAGKEEEDGVNLDDPVWMADAEATDDGPPTGPASTDSRGSGGVVAISTAAHSYVIPLKSRRSATLELPQGFTSEDVEKIRQFLDLFAD